MESRSCSIGIVCGELVPGTWLAMASIGGMITKTTKRYQDPVAATMALLQQIVNEGDVGVAIALNGESVASLETLLTGELKSAD